MPHLYLQTTITKFCTKLAVRYPRGKHRLCPRYGDLPPTRPIERTANVERPDLIQRLQPVSAAEYPDFVLVEHRGVCARRQRRNVCSRERQARPACRDVEDGDVVGAVVLGCALAAADEGRGSYESAQCARHGGSRFPCISGQDHWVVSVMAELKKQDMS